MRKILESVCVVMLRACSLPQPSLSMARTVCPAVFPRTSTSPATLTPGVLTFSLQACHLWLWVPVHLPLLLARYQSLASYPVQTTAESQPRLESLALGMLAWIKAEMVAIFLYIEMISIESASHPDQKMSPLGVWILAGAVFPPIHSPW